MKPLIAILFISLVFIISCTDESVTNPKVSENLYEDYIDYFPMDWDEYHFSYFNQVSYDNWSFYSQGKGTVVWYKTNETRNDNEIRYSIREEVNFIDTVSNMGIPLIMTRKKEKDFFIIEKTDENLIIFKDFIDQPFEGFIKDTFKIEFPRYFTPDTGPVVDFSTDNGVETLVLTVDIKLSRLKGITFMDYTYRGSRKDYWRYTSD